LPETVNMVFAFGSEDMVLTAIGEDELGRR
jgi:hypothetical protein